MKRRGQLGLLVAMGLGSLSLRPQLVGVGPLLPNIQHSLGISHAVAGLLVTIPVLCMGLFAPTAAVLASRVGTNRAVAAALVLVAVAGIARAVSPGAALVLLVTIPVGIGMGLGFSSVSFLLLQQSGAGDVGFHSSAAQMADQLTTATLIGAGGALLTLLGSPALALPGLLAVLAGLSVLGATVANRTASPGQPTDEQESACPR